MKRARLPLLAGLVILVVYLLAWPVVVEPVAWEAPPPSPLEPTGKLQVTRRLALGGGQGPEGTAVGPDGAIYAGLVDGRVVRLEPGSGAVTNLFNAGGRPMGMQLDRAGGLLVEEYLAVVGWSLPAALLFRAFSTLNQALGKPRLVT